MAMVGFSFTKINAERRVANGQAINIESNAGIVGLTELPVIDPKKTVLKFEFSFIVKYEPNAGKIELGGEVVEIYDKEFGSKILEHWTNEKKLHPEVMTGVFNAVLAKSNIQAITISRDLGLPSPIQMPRVDVKPVSKEKTEKSEAKAEKAKK
jgi:hypothetical protein